MDFYEIVVNSHLDARRVNSFKGMKIEQLNDGKSMLSGYLTDQAALCSVISRIHEMGIKLMQVTCRPEENELKMGGI